MADRFGTRSTRRRFLSSVAGAAGLAAAGALLAACGGQPEAPAPTAPPAQSGAPAAGTTPQAVAKPAAAVQGKITVWQWKGFTQAANDLSKKVITDYATTKSWEVDISDVPTDAMAKLMAGVESGDLPDLFQGSGELPQLVGSDALVDVTDVVKELEAVNGPVLPLGQRGGMFKGKWYGVPWTMYADAAFFRGDVLEKAGKKVEDYRTFDQIRDLLLELSDPAAQLWGWGLTPKAATGDGDILARHVINSPETIEALKWLVDTYTNPKYAKMLPNGVLGWDGGANNENFLGGKIIFTQNASSLYWAAKNQQNPYAESMVLTQFPVGPKHELMGGYPYFHMTFQKSKNRDAAIEIAKHQAESKQIYERVRTASGQAWPMYQKQVDAQEVKDYIGSDKNLEVLFKNCTHKSGWMVGWPANPNPAINASHNQNLPDKCMEEAVNKKGSVEDLVKQYHQRMVDIFVSYGYKQ